MEEEKRDYLRQVVSSTEVVEVNLLSELSGSARVLAWEMFILATCTQDKALALGKFFARTVREPGERRKFNHILVEQDCFVVPKLHWLSKENDIARNSTYFSNFRVENTQEGERLLPNGVLWVLEEREWEILQEKKRALEERYPFDNLTQSQIERRLIEVANAMGFDLTNEIFLIKVYGKLSETDPKVNNDDIDRDVLKTKITSTLESMEKRGLLKN